MRRRLSWLLLPLWGCLACERTGGAEPEKAARKPTDSGLTRTLGEQTGAEGASARSAPPEPACAPIRAKLGKPLLPFEPEPDARRVEILGRARAVPVFFFEPPEPPPTLSRTATAYREELLKSPDPAAVTLRILRETRRDLSLRRDVFLTNGYLFTTQPMLAVRLSQILRFDHLFDAEKLRVWRGDELFEVVRVGDRYRRAGTETDASLLLYDRMDDLSSPRARPLHADFSKLQAELGFRSLRVTGRSETGLWVEWNYGESPLADSVKSQGHVHVDAEGRALRDCEEVEPALEAKLDGLRRAELELRADFLPLKRAIDAIVELRLPFDEPRTEYGQEDGQLRRAFAEAYRKGAETYEYNDDRYYVFDNKGRVRLPEVCIDFITDAFDWATGGSWAPRGKGRKRVRGALHLPSLGMENPRSVENLALFATQHPEWFDVYWAPKNEQIRFNNRSAFFGGLLSNLSQFRLGDVVFINGLRDDERYHYHSFFLYEMDPLTGFPLLLAANAGPPQMRTWEGEMAGAPRRFVVARLRIRPEILRLAYDQAARAPGVPLALPKDPAIVP